MASSRIAGTHGLLPTPSHGVANRPGLPRTSTFVRSRPMRLWWWAVAIAVITNSGLVLALSQVSRLHVPAPDVPLAVRRLHHVDTAPPPPPPEQRHETQEAVPREAVPFALPSLDLPATAPAGALALPADGSLVTNFDLPMSIPAFTPIGPISETVAPPGPAIVAAPPVFDTPAEREGAFDLERHYPRTARMRGITGTTRIHFTITNDGRVDGVRVLTSQPEGVFEQAAERLGRSLHFRPARSGGQPVPSEQELVIEWTIK